MTTEARGEEVEYDEIWFRRSARKAEGADGGSRQHLGGSLLIIRVKGAVCGGYPRILYYLWVSRSAPFFLMISRGKRIWSTRADREEWSRSGQGTQRADLCRMGVERG